MATDFVVLSFSFSLFLSDAEWRAPDGVTSKTTQHCCENNCHNIRYHEETGKSVRRDTSS